MRTSWLLLLLLLTLPAAAHPHAPPEEEPPAPRAGERSRGVRRAFDEARAQLLKHYYKEGLTDDGLYRAAVRGMLQHADPAMRRWNKLLSPGEMAELKGDIKGELVGVGVEIQFDA